MMTAAAILKNKSLSVTIPRKIILEIFIKASRALSHASIENSISTIIDRATIYRTLQTFLESGIIHQIPTTNNVVLYALCQEECSIDHHHDEHVHFICTACDTTICMEKIIVPKVKLPRGFKMKNAALIIKGTCDICKN